MNQHKLNIVESLVKGLCSSYGESRALYRHKLLEAVKTLTDEEFESLNELSKKTLGSYVKKASGSSSLKAFGAGNNAGTNKPYRKELNKSLQRDRNIKKAVDKLTK